VSCVADAALTEECLVQVFDRGLAELEAIRASVRIFLVDFMTDGFQERRLQWSDQVTSVQGQVQDILSTKSAFLKLGESFAGRAELRACADFPALLPALHCRD
jgi:hypothetical protein